MGTTAIGSGNGADSCASTGHWADHDGHQHGVQFYSQDKFLLEKLSSYIGSALRGGEAAIVVATEVHREGLNQWLTAQGVDIASLTEQGRLVALDARRTLDTFLSEGWPNESRFNEVVGGIIADALAKSTGTRPGIKIFGEMVALLWAEEKTEAAIHLEQLWNKLARQYPFELLCAYPISNFHRKEDAELLLRVCNEHSSVTPAEGYSQLTSEDERLRLIAQLQQKAKALETEIADHKTLRQELELHVQARTAELQSKNVQLLEEIKKRHDAETSLRTLTSQLMLIRDEERRRVAHELHESTAQVLSTLGMNLRVLSDEQSADSRESKLLAESTTLVDGLLGEVRQLSHLLHPPTLDEMGLPSAIQWYAENFSKRTNIEVTIKIAKDFGRLSREREIAIFRVVQEALANVQKHSGSSTATVSVSRSWDYVCVLISDVGKGMSSCYQENRSGVGIDGMRERLRQLGGALNVHSTENGTLLTANLPVGEI